MANDFTVSNFAGSFPRMAKHLLPKGSAAKALDCNLHSGALTSWRELKKVRQTEGGTLTVYRLGCCWLDFDACVDVAHGSVNCERLFVTGAEAYPAVLEVDGDCAITTRRLGVPCPTHPLSVTAGSEEDSVEKDLEGRSYAYQYVNKWGEAGALSPGSPAENLRDGQHVVLSGWPVPDASWGVTYVRIYRTVSGHQSGYEEANTPDTTWMEVAGVPVDSASFTDTRYNEELLNALEEEGLSSPPPTKLRGIVWIESMNCLAGFVGNRVYFSDNGKYHHWPHYLDLDDNVKALVESNGLIYAATDGRPYVIEAAVDCVAASCRSAVRLSTAYPMVGSGSRKMARVRAGAVYPTHNGLVLLAGKSGPSLITWPMYSPEEWQKLEPHTVTPVEYGGKLFVFAAGGSFVMPTVDNPESGWGNDMHSQLSDTGVLDAFLLRSGELMLLKADEGLYHWNAGATLRPHLWQSSEFVSATPIHQGCVNVEFSGAAETLTLEVDGRTVLSREVHSSRVMRLPMWATGQRWQITLSGTAAVRMFSVAPSMHDLSS